MPSLRLLIILGVVIFFLVVAGAGAGVWWYFFGTNELAAAELVPSDTVAFATIPNAMTIASGYQTSHLKTLVDSPNSQPAHDAIAALIGQKNLDLINAFAPNLSGQSFVAVTHFDLDHPQQIGFVAAMKPKPGLGDFNGFVDKLKATWPDVLKQGTTGAGNVAGVDYQWIQGPGAPDKICVAQFHGWIVTTWGEKALQDWIERFEGKSTTPSLARNPDYQKSLTRVGPDPMALLYLNYHAVADLLQKQVGKTNPAMGGYFSRKFGALGGAMIATRFENGEIVDRFSILVPHAAQLESGVGVTPCPFDTLKFTGPDTRLYLASSIDWKQYAKDLHDQIAVNPAFSYALTSLQSLAQASNLDIHHNIIDALGSEVSFQVEWTAQEAFPQAALFVKLDQPDDFKPVEAAIVAAVGKAYDTSAVVREIDSNGQKFAALKFVRSSAFTPTITESGPYLGIFMTENLAVRSYQRDAAGALPNNADFARQIGDKRNGASQLIFLDSPQLLNRAYQTALPYLSIASMFNKTLADLLKGKNLPPDLTWMAPMGTWSLLTTPDEDGIAGYSISGVGNQGIFLGGVVGGGFAGAQMMGWLPKAAGAPGTVFVPGTPPVPSPLNPPGTLLQPRRVLTPIFPRTPSLPALPSGPTEPITSATESVVTITADGKIYLDATPVDPGQVGDLMKIKKAANQDLKMAVVVDKRAPAGLLQPVMDAGASSGFGVLTVFYKSNVSPVALPGSAATPTAGSADSPTPAPALPPAPAVPPNPAPAAATNSPTTNATPDANPPTPAPSQ